VGGGERKKKIRKEKKRKQRSGVGKKGKKSIGRCFLVLRSLGFVVLHGEEGFFYWEQNDTVLYGFFFLI
jgi:hypothetical protein